MQFLTWPVQLVSSKQAATGVLRPDKGLHGHGGLWNEDGRSVMPQITAGSLKRVVQQQRARYSRQR